MSLELLRINKQSRRKTRFGHVTLAAVVVLFLVSTMVPSYGAVLVEWNIPSGAVSIPYDIVVDSSHQVWFSEFGNDKLGRLTSGTFFEYALPPGSRPWGIGSTTDYIWIAESGLNRIARFREPQLDEFALPAFLGNREIRGLAVENSTLIWFAQFNGHGIGLLNLTGQNLPSPKYNFTIWTLPRARDNDPGPQAVVWSDSTGLWYVDYSRDIVGNIRNSFSGLVREYYLQTGSRPWDVDIDSGGNIWFTESGRNSIGKLNPATNEITEYAIPTSGSEPFGLTVDNLNRVWFAEHGTNKIGVYVPGVNTFTEFTRTQTGAPYALSTDSGRYTPIWFTDAAQNRIGKVDPSIGLTTISGSALSSAATSSTTTSPTTTSLLSNTYTVQFGSTIKQFNWTKASSIFTTLSRSESFTQSTSYTGTETVTLVQTTTTATVTTTSTVATLATTQTVTVTSNVATTTDTTTYVTETGTTTINIAPIPGYPIESVIAGIGLAATALVILRRRRSLDSVRKSISS